MVAKKSKYDSRNITIVVASHKPYWIPSDAIYLPVQVGAIGKPTMPGFERDDKGKNISELNSRYCELTALYWAVKNINANYIGLAHYRRHFSGSGEKGTLNYTDAIELLSHTEIILPKRRNYYIETLESHYAHTHDGSHLKALRNAVVKLAPDYIDEFDNHLSSRCGHMFNMMIMRRDVLEVFCDWMFPILFETERQIRFDKLSPFQERLMGRLSELLIDVWINHCHLNYIEQPIVEMEKTNWIKKGSAFIAAKAMGKSYSKSF